MSWYARHHGYRDSLPSLADPEPPEVLVRDPQEDARLHAEAEAAQLRAEERIAWAGKLALRADAVAARARAVARDAKWTRDTNHFSEGIAAAFAAPRIWKKEEPKNE